MTAGIALKQGELCRLGDFAGSRHVDGTQRADDLGDGDVMEVEGDEGIIYFMSRALRGPNEGELLYNFCRLVAH